MYQMKISAQICLLLPVISVRRGSCTQGTIKETRQVTKDRDGLKRGAQIEWIEMLSPGGQRATDRNGPGSNGLAESGKFWGLAGDRVRWWGLKCPADGLEWMGEATGNHCWLGRLFPSLQRQPPSHAAEQFPKAFSLICDCFPNPEAARVSSFCGPKREGREGSKQSGAAKAAGLHPQASPLGDLRVLSSPKPPRVESRLCGGACGMTELVWKPRDGFRAGTTHYPQADSI